MSVQLPATMVYSRAGLVPYVVDSLLSYIPHLPQFKEVPLFSVSHLSPVAFNSKSFENVVGRKVFLTINDASLNVQQSGFNTNKSVSVWHNSGRIEFNAASYLDVVNRLKPSLYQTLFDGDTPKGSNKKKIVRSSERSLKFAEETSNAPLLSLVGGYDGVERSSFFSNVNQFLKEGVTFEGLNYGNSFDFQSFSNCFQSMAIPECRIRCLLVPASPYLILHAYPLVNLFSGSYPFVMTEQRYMLFKEGKFYYDETLPNCSCYACAQFSRTYLQHLIDTKELLGLTLLMIHNMTFYFDFFEKMRSAIQDNTFEKFKSDVLKFYSDN